MSTEPNTAAATTHARDAAYRANHPAPGLRPRHPLLTCPHVHRRVGAGRLNLCSVHLDLDSICEIESVDCPARVLKSGGAGRSPALPRTDQGQGDGRGQWQSLKEG
jgi:hypothetical protein